jgi:hypothetical protein
MRPIKKIALAMFGIISAISAGTASASTCQAPVTGTGAAVANTVLARSRAVTDWAFVAKQTYGATYMIWPKAAQQSMTCTIAGKFPKTHTCKAVAKPCS